MEFLHGSILSIPLVNPRKRVNGCEYYSGLCGLCEIYSLDKIAESAKMSIFIAKIHEECRWEEFCVEIESSVTHPYFNI